MLNLPVKLPYNRLSKSTWLLTVPWSGKSSQTLKPNLLQTYWLLLWTTGASQCIFWKCRGRVPILSCLTQSRTECDQPQAFILLSVLHLVSIATIKATTLFVKLKLTKWKSESCLINCTLKDAHSCFKSVTLSWDLFLWRIILIVRQEKKKKSETRI